MVTSGACSVTQAIDEPEATSVSEPNVHESEGGDLDA